MSEWSNWGRCSATCGQGTQTRSRTCQGNNCRENLKQSKNCYQPGCVNSWSSLGIPQYGPVGQYYCKSGDYYLATSFYTSNKRKVETECKKHNCDVIVEWSRNSYDKTFRGWDLGRYDAQPCPQNQKMTTKIIWQKDFEDYMNSNHTINGEINFHRPVTNLSRHLSILPKI